MTVEEALVALLAAVAGVLLYVGLAQALGDDRPGALEKPAPPRVDSPRSVSRARDDGSKGSLRQSPPVLSGHTEG